MVVKARLGFRSLALYVCDELVQLEKAYERTARELRDGIVDKFLPLDLSEWVLIQQSVRGPERCISILNDLAGRHAAHFICEVHAMRAGESDSATSLPQDALGDLPLRLSKLTKHVGIWGVDVLMDGGAPKVIDINPRFSGDYPFHHLAGANAPASLLAWAQGKEPAPEWLVPTIGVRGFKDIVPMRGRVGV